MYTVSVVLLKAKVDAPEVPALVDTRMGSMNSQHSSAELLCAFVTIAVACRKLLLVAEASIGAAKASR